MSDFKNYYHITAIDYTEIVYCTEDDAMRDTFHGNYYGPFSTLQQCKKDAREYHQCTIRKSREALKKINETKIKDLK